MPQKVQVLIPNASQGRVTLTEQSGFDLDSFILISEEAQLTLIDLFTVLSRRENVDVLSAFLSRTKPSEDMAGLRYKNRNREITGL